MKDGIAYLAFAVLSLGLISTPLAQEREHTLGYFLGKASSDASELSAEERTELLDRIEGLVKKVQTVHMDLTHFIQSGEYEIRYQEGKFWMSKLERDEESIKTATEQITLLKNKSTLLLPSVKLYKALRDLSSNFDAYINVPHFSAYIGDMAPEMELWTDPVFYKLHLLPLVREKEKEKEKEVKPPAKEVPKNQPRPKSPPPAKDKAVPKK